MSRNVAASKLLVRTLTPFLYPCLDSTWVRSSRVGVCAVRLHPRTPASYRSQSTASSEPLEKSESESDQHRSNVDVFQYDHLNPTPPDYSSQPFTDACTLSVSAGGGGHGCISFLREKYIANGPPNGGDGGTGGSIYIQAVRGETSLHKLARRGIIRAGRGKNGQGSLKGGARGEDVLVTVPVGTVIREVSRVDPLKDEETSSIWAKSYGSDRDNEPSRDDGAQPGTWRRDKWLIYPGSLPRSFSSADFPVLPRPRRNSLVAMQPRAPLRLDLDKPMDTPMILAAGAMGGLGNPHFVTRSITRPKFATKGDDGMRINLHLELKLLADVGLVGLPNAGKSTLLRAITRSRTRVGEWAFTTLNPSIGSVVLDSHIGRPELDIKDQRKEPRTHVSVADIPGLIEDAHLDRGLGLGFLRHIERAAVLAFVIDLSSGDATQALKALWREVGKYENLRERELNVETQRLHQSQDITDPFRSPFESSISPGFDPEPVSSRLVDDSLLDPPANRDLTSLALPPISSKPWLVVGTKADLPNTQENFVQLQNYLKRVQDGDEEHPCGKKNAWRKVLYSVPVSAINKEGVESLPNIILQLLQD